MSEQPALGNRGDGSTRLDLAQSTAQGLNGCEFVSWPLATILRKPGSPGPYTFGLRAIVADVTIPFVIGTYQAAAGSPAGDPYCMLAAGALPLWAGIHRLAAWKNRHVEHSYFVGETIFLRRCSPAAETAMGAALAYGCSFFSPGLAVMFAVSAAANAIHLTAVNIRRGLAAQKLRDAELEGRLAVQDYKDLRRR